MPETKITLYVKYILIIFKKNEQKPQSSPIPIAKDWFSWYLSSMISTINMSPTNIRESFKLQALRELAISFLMKENKENFKKHTEIATVELDAIKH